MWGSQCFLHASVNPYVAMSEIVEMNIDRKKEEEVGVFL